MTRVIELREVTKVYGDTAVVDEVSGTIQSGGVVSIIGANGAGKSTLLSMISRLLPMDDGDVFVDELDVQNTPSNLLAKKLSILRQDNQLSVRLTVRDLVAFGRFPHNKGRRTPEDQEHIDRALAYLHLEELADRYLDELSGGQRQRAFIAMVIAQDTDYVLLDEPLNNLDMKHAVEMMQLLRRMATDFGKTIVIVIHDINFASCYSDTIVCMCNGKLVRHGSPEEIMDTDVLREIYGIDIRILDVEGQRIGVYYHR